MRKMVKLINKISNSRHKYKFTRIQQLTVGGHARNRDYVPKKRNQLENIYSNREEKVRMYGANPYSQDIKHSTGIQ